MENKILIDSVNNLKVALNEISVYDFDVYTSMELYYKIAENFNKVIKELSRFEGVISEEIVKQNEKLIYLLGEGLNQEVVNKIDNMVETGVFDTIINHNIFNNLKEDIKNISSQLEHNKKINKINIKDLGAIGDWNSHPASEFYSSLEELQKDFPLAISLDEEIDSLALEKAIANEFREIYIPYGGYKINKSFTLKDNQRLIGAGRNLTMLDCDESLTNIITINGTNVNIEHLRFTTDFNIGETGSPNIKTTCINNNQKAHLKLNDLYIVGFNVGINYGENAWCIYNNRLRIQNCNTGVKANGEFNNVSFYQNTVTYCKTCYRVGGGSNVIFQSCDIERSDIGIVKTNIGDVNIENCYFEFNKNGSICIEWGLNSPDYVLIEGCSFFTTGNGEKIIKYHTDINSKIIIKKNTFRSWNITSGVKVKCLIPSNGTQVKPIFENNLLTSDYEIGVGRDKINYENYYENGLRMSYTTNVTSDLTEDKPSLRSSFVNGASIKLPSFKDRFDTNKCYKLLFYTNSPVEGESMRIDTTIHSVIGENKILPNQIYSIYYNRFTEGKEEIILAKG